MDVIGAGGGHGPNLFSQLREVGGEDRWCDPDRLLHGDLLPA
jgi:hypothetical protein